MVPKITQLGAAIRAARTPQKLSQSGLAALAGVSRATIAQLEIGGGRLDSLVSATAALGLTLGGAGLPPGDIIGHRLAALRQTRGISLRSIAEATGLTRPTIRAIEAGSQTVQIAAVVALAAALAVKLTATDAKKAFYQSSQYDAWLTPPDLATALTKAVSKDGMWDLDPASPGSDASFIQAHRHHTQAENGLEQPWHGRVWLNPPYGRNIARWLAKASNEVAAGRASIVVMLLPAKTDTGWYHDHVAGEWHRHLRGRVQFHASTTSGPAIAAPGGSVIVVIGGADDDMRRIDLALDAYEGRRKAA